MTEIEALLARLKELEPRRRERIREEDHYQLDDPARLWMIQGVIQEAIAARGWGFYISTECDNWWDVENISDMEITFAASILLPDDEMCDFWDGLQLEWCRGDTPAEALLRAYIKALEAQQGVSE